MYKCHLCELETKQLNGLMSRHYQKHCLNGLSKEQYKRDLLIFNGRSPNNCKICNKETTIPKGESEYPQYCRSCFVEKLKNSNGELNANWRGGKRIANCAFCNSKIEKHSSHLKRLNKFCSTSCCQMFYALPENRTDAQKANDEKSKEMFTKYRTNLYCRAKLAEARNNLATSRSSKKEREMVDIIKTIHTDCVGGHLVKYYTFDAFIPSLEILVEFDGTYWHSLPATISLDKRKSTYIKKWHPNLKLVRVKEGDWDIAINKLKFIEELLNSMNL